MAFRRRWLAAGAVVAAAAIAVSVSAVAAGPDEKGLITLSAAPLGVNVAPWDAVYADPGGSAAQALLKSAGIRQLRYGGGSYADIYDWQTSTDLSSCLPDHPAASFTGGCAGADPLSFAAVSRRARAIGADTLITVNYGTGTPALAAAWAAAAARTAGEQVALWEVGNESYGCWEVDNELAGAPAYYKGYRPGMGSAAGRYQSCPDTTEGPAAGTRTLATSYAQNALRFMRAIRAADPGAVMGVPWAFGANDAASSVADNGEWNSIVLGTDGGYAGFVDAHYYPFAFSGAAGGANPSASRILHALRAIPALAASIRAGLAAHDPGAAMVVGETGVSTSPTTTVCTPVGAVFAAADTLAWLAAGAQSVDWWDLNNYANTGTACTKPDYGLLTSARTPAPETPYYGYLLASRLAQPGARLGVITTSDPADVLAYQSVLPSGAHAVAFINLNATAARTITCHPTQSLDGTLRAWVYRAANQDAAESRISTATARAGTAVTLPPESVTIWETQ